MSENPPPDFGGRWSDVKLKALEKYLYAYRTVLKRSDFSIEYIDAFAGGGRIEAGAKSEEDEQESDYRHGSPLIALGVDPSFHKFHFVEKSGAALARLKSQIEESGYGGRNICYYEDDANLALQQICRGWKRNRRAVAFLDPFAMHLQWSTLEEVAKTEAIDMWLLFPAMAVNRMLPRNGHFTPSNRAKLNNFFGCNDWKAHFYQETDKDLFDVVSTYKTQGGFDVISRFIQRRLREVFAGTTSSHLVLKNSRDAPIFFLCFACSNPSPRAKRIALRIAQYIIDNL